MSNYVSFPLGNALFACSFGVDWERQNEARKRGLWIVARLRGAQRSGQDGHSDLRMGKCY